MNTPNAVRVARRLGRIPDHLTVLGVLRLAAALGVIAHALPVGATDLISTGVNGRAGNAASGTVAVNGDGTVVAFTSDATNLVSGDTNQFRDVFVRMRNGGFAERVSVNTGGVQANRASHANGGAPAINGAGDIVAFYSDATNLVDNDTNGQSDVFVRIRGASPSTERVSISTDGTQANGSSVNPSISSDGRYVAFQSQATNLVGNDTNGVADIFVRDRVAGTTERVCDSVQANGPSSSPSISADGFSVAFASAAANLVDGDTNGHLDVFVCDRRTGSIERVSVSSAGVQGNDDSILPSISGLGCVVAFKSLANNLVPNDNNGVVDVFVRDRTGGFTERISVDPHGNDANDASFPPNVNYDGRYVAFGSFASNLVAADFNRLASVFVRDRQVGETRLVDLNNQGEQANGGTPDVPPGMSGDGTQVGFVSIASNLAANDLNDVFDVFAAANPFTRPLESNDCCECDNGEPSCSAPIFGACPQDCLSVCDAACLEPDTEGPARCATFTPTPATPTPTNTPGAGDCCQCGGPACQRPQSGTCPAACPPVFGAACLAAGPEAGTCATFTPTATPTTTPGPNDCCQCQDAVPFCARPVAGTCPQNCDAVFLAACIGPATPGTGQCATFTPGGSLTPTPTVTATIAVGTATATRSQTATGTATVTPSAATTTPTATSSGIATATPTATTTAPRCPTGTPDGAPCDDGNLCTRDDTCRDGLCVGTPIDCSAADICHDAGTCNPATGQCPNPRPNGTTCNDGDLCTQGDSCQGGFCTGTLSDCTSADGCHDAGTCNPTTGECPNPRPDGTSCSDGNGCTRDDACQAGFCKGTPIDCSVADGCHDAGTCNPATGQCPNPRPNGSACDDGVPCTQGDVCRGGFCSGVPIDCSHPDQCHNPGTCDPVTGQCTNSKADGASCDDGLFCTTSDSCRGGTCTGTPRTCDDGRFCDGTETCNEATDSCQSSGNPCPNGQICDESSRQCRPGSQPTPSPTRVHLDKDSCHCATVPVEERSRTRALAWLAGPVALLVWRRRVRAG